MEPLVAAPGRKAPARHGRSRMITGDAMKNALQLGIPADVRYLRIVRRVLEEVCGLLALDAEATGDVVLATEEAVTNIIVHAYCGGTGGRIELRVTPTRVGLEVAVEDEGEPFAGDEVVPPDPAEIRPGGRGVFLIRKLMDEVRYRPKPTAGTVLTMLKRCDVASDLSEPRA